MEVIKEISKRKKGKWLVVVHSLSFCFVCLFFSHWVLSDSLWSHELLSARLSVLQDLPGLLKLLSTESVMPPNHLILCRPLLLPPSIFPSIRVFSSESALCIRRPKYWSFSFSPSNEYPRLISFRIDRVDLFAVQGTLKSLLQHHYSKASILRHSAFIIVQIFLYVATEKSMALAIWAFVGKVMSQLFNTMSRFIIAPLPRS